MKKKSVDQQSNNGMASGLGVWGGLWALIIWKLGGEGGGAGAGHPALA